LKSGQVHAVRIQKGGKTYHRIFGDLTKFEPGMAKLASGTVVFESGVTAKDPHIPGFQRQAYDPKTDTTKLSGTPAYSTSGYTGHTSGGSSLSVATGSFTFKNTFVLDVPEAADPEKELAEAMVMLGKDPAEAMAEPTADDELLLKKFQIAQHLGGPAAFNSAKPSDFTHAKLDARLASLGGEALVANAQVMVDHSGKHAVVIDDYAAIKADGVNFAYVGADENAISQRLIEGVGPGSRQHRLIVGGGMAGQNEGASAESDLTTGGSRGVFARTGTSKMDHAGGFGMKCGGALMIFHPRVYQRTDWWAYRGDSYGVLNPSSLKWNPSKAVTRKDFGTLGDEINNEVLFEGGLALRDMAGVSVTSALMRDTILASLAKAEITQINGIPVEKFVVLRAGSSRSELAAGLVGLKEGVLA
jgi:hypothetical protein